VLPLEFCNTVSAQKTKIIDIPACDRHGDRQTERVCEKRYIYHRELLTNYKMPVKHQAWHERKLML